jgi:hypothetical protein
MLVATGLLACLLMATASLGVIYAARSQAMAAADAAALSAAVATHPGTGRDSPHEEARRVAMANGAVLQVCDCRVDSSLRTRSVTVRAAVTVEAPIFGSVTVSGVSRAEFDPGSWLGRQR